MLVGRTGKLVRVAVTLTLTGGCQSIGPNAIDAGRDRYNNVLQSTAMEQTLSNIVRARNNEPMAFMDVSEVDAVTTFTGSVGGAISGIGAKAGASGGTLAGQQGGVTAGATYAETPTVRYLPLTGQGLVAQLVNPLSPDALESLYNSSWKAGPLFDMATAYQTFNFDYNAAAANLTAVLSMENWLSLEATKSELTKAQDSTSSGTLRNSSSGNVTLEVTNKASGGGANDALTLYLRPWDETFTQPQSFGRLYFWAWLLRIYHGTQSDFTPGTNPNFTSNDLNFCQRLNLYRMTGPTSYQLNEAGLKSLLTDLLQKARKTGGLTPDERKYLAGVRKCLPDSIELRTASVARGKEKGLVSPAPLLKTFSALGILKHASGQNNPKFEFVTPEQYRKYQSYPWNDPLKTGKNFGFYTLLPCDEDSVAANPDHHYDDWNVGVWILLYNDIAIQHNFKFTTLDPFLSAYAPLVYWPALDRQEFDQWNSKETNALTEDCPGYHAGSPPTGDPTDLIARFITGNIRLAELRRYILIVKDDHPPANAYAAHFDQGAWYYIDGDDKISQKNFELVSLFLTMMAVPATTQPLTPTINVGAGG